jgi:hypothetical protein
MLRVVRCLALITAILSASCAEPPSKEMNQAQGAIDAARAAGADKFASIEFNAAIEALKRSEEAVVARDYRQALNHALDSRERAQNAAKLAVEGRADARGQAERGIAEVATLLSRAQAQLKDPDIARVSPPQLKAPRATIAAAEGMLQEARTALKAEDYPAVAKALNGTAARLQAALTQIDAAASPRPSGRKR